MTLNLIADLDFVSNLLWSLTSLSWKPLFYRFQHLGKSFFKRVIDFREGQKANEKDWTNITYSLYNVHLGGKTTPKLTFKKGFNNVNLLKTWNFFLLHNILKQNIYMHVHCMSYAFFFYECSVCMVTRSIPV